MTMQFNIPRFRPCSRLWLILIVAAGGLLSACASTRVTSDFDRSASFREYRTYAWLPHERGSVHNPLIARFAMESIDAELNKKGFVLATDPASADFKVDFTIGAQDRVDVSSYPAGYRGPWGWGRRYYGDLVDVRQYREGTLAVDIFDARTNQPVWTGRATKEISRSDQARSDGPIRVATTALLEQFPPLSSAEQSKHE